jgi:hypothetical protein
MRGTLHVLPSSELALWQSALAESPRYLRAAAWQNYYGISLEELEAITGAVGRALHNRLLTRQELAQEVAVLLGREDLAEKIAQSSWGTVLKPAAFTGLLCFAPSVAQAVRFTNPVTWLNLRHLWRNPEAVATVITRRFLAAYGPATYHDLARWWNGGGVGSGRKWLDALGNEVMPVQIEGKAAWILSCDAQELADSILRRSVRLLPGFDQYVVASSCHVEQLLSGAVRSRIFRPQGWISAVVLVNGRIEGVWTYKLKGAHIDVVIEPFTEFRTWVRRAVAEEAERLAAFFDRRLRLSYA